MRTPPRSQPLALFLLCLLTIAILSGCRQSNSNSDTLKTDDATDGVRVEQNVPYGTAGGHPLLLDAYLPPGNGQDRPAILWIHGGSWMAGRKQDWADVARQMAQAGYVGFALDYRLFQPGSKANRWPAQIDDARRAVRWVRENARRFGVDPHRIAAFGHSSGGQMAALLGTTDAPSTDGIAGGPRISSRVEAVVDLAGPVDFLHMATDPPLSPQEMNVPAQVIGKTLVQSPALYRSFSPTAQIDSHTVPFLVLYGTEDSIVPTSQGERMASALRAARRDVTLAKRKGAGHVLRSPEDLEWLQSQMKRFFLRTLKPSSQSTEIQTKNSDLSGNRSATLRPSLAQSIVK